MGSPVKIRRGPATVSDEGVLHNATLPEEGAALPLES